MYIVYCTYTLYCIEESIYCFGRVAEKCGETPTNTLQLVKQYYFFVSVATSGRVKSDFCQNFLASYFNLRQTLSLCPYHLLSLQHKQVDENFNLISIQYCARSSLNMRNIVVSPYYLLGLHHYSEECSVYPHKCC